MKIKADFVTNSSSTSYVAMAPIEFKIPDQEIIELGWKNEIEVYFAEDVPDEEINKKLIEEFYQTIDKIRNGETIWSGDDIRTATFDSVVAIFEKMNLILASIDTGPDDGKLIGVEYSKAKDILTRAEKCELS